MGGDGMVGGGINGWDGKEKLHNVFWLLLLK